MGPNEDFGTEQEDAMGLPAPEQTDAVMAALDNPSAVGENPQEVNDFRHQFESQVLEATSDSWEHPGAPYPNTLVGANNNENFAPDEGALDSRLAS